MYNIRNFVFFQDVSSAGESNVWNNPNKGSVMTLEVQGSGTLDLEIKGVVNVEYANPTYTPIAAIDMSTLTKAVKITKPGIYSFGVDGIDKIKAVLNSVSGTFTVFAKVGD